MSNKIIKIEKKKYFSTKKQLIKGIITNSDDYQIWKFQLSLRKAEDYKRKANKCKIYNLPYLYYKRKKNKLGRKLGFSIPEGCFDQGLRIYHIGSIAINPKAIIGKNCIIVGNVCIGNTNGKNIAPHIGDNCMLGWGATVIGNITIADNCSVAAGAVVVKNVEKNNSVMVGIPAKNINKE